MSTKISPYAGSVHLTSPDGRFAAAIDEAAEIGMGSPTYGKLKVSGGLSFEGCNTSLVWSDDSRYLTAPQLTPYPYHRLLVIAVGERRYGYAPGYFGFPEIHSFSGGKIKGVDSPESSRPREIEIHVNQVRWNDQERDE
jgi:hypothetical protein